jgi:ribose 5-phosphate isomerase B
MENTSINFALRVGIAADHEGFELKEKIRMVLGSLKFEMLDYGPFELTPGDDYPDFIIPLAKAISSGQAERGIAICGSGIGASIACNKVRGARGGLIHDLFSARQGVEDDDMNIICLGAKLVDLAFALELVEVFLMARFSGDARFKRRLEKVKTIEELEIQP